MSQDYSETIIQLLLKEIYLLDQRIQRLEEGTVSKIDKIISVPNKNIVESPFGIELAFNMLNFICQSNKIRWNAKNIKNINLNRKISKELKDKLNIILAAFSSDNVKETKPNEEIGIFNEKYFKIFNKNIIDQIVDLTIVSLFKFDAKYDCGITFKNIGKQPFWLDDETNIKKDFLSTKHKLKIFKSKGSNYYDGIIIDMISNGIKLGLILCKNEIDLDAIFSVNENKTMKEELICIQIPKFEINADIDLSSKYDIQIEGYNRTEMKQICNIKVDSNGVSGGAATVISATRGMSTEPTLIFNKPFYFSVVTEDKIVLLEGYFNG